MAVGAKRIGTYSESPGPISNGNDSASGTSKAPEVEVMLVTLTGHSPLLLMTNGCSAKWPTQTLPKPPRLPISRLRRGRGATPDTCTKWGEVGSLLSIRIVAAKLPTDFGAKRIGTSIESPTSSLIGYDSTLGDSKSVVDALMLLMRSRPVPLLSMVSTMSLNDPTQQSPNAPWSAITVVTLGIPKVSLKKNGSIEVGTGVTPSLPSRVFVAQLTLR